MSISGDIKKRIREHHGTRLFFLPPLMPGDGTFRELIASTEVYENVIEPWPKNYYGRRLAEFRANLDAFTIGDEMSVSEEPYDKSRDTDIARVDPVGDEIWDLRCVSPEAKIRCFGRFADKNLFVALTWQYREDISDPGDFDDEVERCKTEWADLFGSTPLYKGESVDDYISNYYVERA